ncbi:MAG: chalcone isomerase family protein [Bdellovibrionaceae bacterium]|nr:chalcone isomerase family protein [Pseudobdellovibrionaceae bacterium]
MRKFFFVLSSILLFQMCSSAETINVVSSQKKLNGVTLSSEISLKEKKIFLKNIGAGLRVKKKFVMNFDVYVGELLVQEPEKVKKNENEVLESLVQQKAVGFQLTFLRSVEMEAIKNSFQEAFRANSIDINSTDIKEFLEKVVEMGNMQKGEHFSVIVTKNEKASESLLLVDKKNNVLQFKDGQWSKNIFSIWFGKTEDPGVQKMRSQILN